MYQNHFGLCEAPFTLTPNTDFYCDLEGHRCALEVLMTALHTGEGFIKVVGEVGTGKTLLCRKLLNDLSEHYVSAYVPNPYLRPDELRLHIAQELQVNVTGEPNQQWLSQALQQRLLEINQQGKTVVVVLDEAQALPSESLEALRLISNLETESRKLVQIVLFGQPELDERLAQREHRQLRQRISFSYHLQAMNVQEVATYISHRMHIAGYRGQPLMSPRVVAMLHRASRGIPRLVNVLCHKVLLLSYGEGTYVITPEQVRFAVADTEDATPLSSPWWYGLVGAGVLILVLIGSAWSLGWFTEYVS